MYKLTLFYTYNYIYVHVDKAVSPTISTSPVCTCGSQYKDLLLSSPMLDDSNIDQDITWDEHKPTCTCQKGIIQQI